MSTLLRWAVVCCVFVGLGCSDSVQRIVKTPGTAQPENIAKSILNSSDNALTKSLLSPCTVTELYTARRYNLIWVKSSIITPQGDSLLAIVHKASYYGLLPERYHLSEIDSLREEAAAGNEGKEQSLAELDILMTDALFTIGYHIKNGRVHYDGSSWMPVTNTDDAEVNEVLEHAINKNSLSEGLEQLEPSYLSYKILKRELNRKLDSLSLAHDDSIRVVLNNRITDLMINMEQWRLEDQDLSGRHILVNIPSFRLAVKDHDSLVFESRVVVGTPQTPTPTLDSNIKSFVLYPYWNVPRGIATNELLPRIKRDTTYLKSHAFRVIDPEGNSLDVDSINWRKYHVNNFPFMLQQAEGESNALGIVKFTFNNERAIYLHDTNAKRFFKRDKRAYSHGCVRVERAIDLAKFLAGEDNKADDVDEFLKEKEQKYVSINPIDLHIRYFTCEPHEDGSVSFYDDIYHWNDGIRNALYCMN